MRLSVPYRDVPLQEWIGAAAAIAAVFVVVVAVRSTARLLLRKLSPATVAGRLLLEVASRTHPALFIFPTVYMTSVRLEFIHRDWLRTGTELSVIAQAAFWIGGVIQYTLKRFEDKRAIDPNAATTFRIWRISAVVLMWVVAILIALSVAGVDVRTLLTGLGIGGVAVALATQNILSELFASLSILIEKPFVVGDWIQVGDDIGVVDKISLKTTRVWALSGEQLIYSNSEILKKTIHNLGRGTQRRVVSRIRADYGTPPPTLMRVPSIVRQAAESQPNVKFDRVHLANFGPLGFEFELVYFITSRDVMTWMDSQQSVLLAITHALSEAGVFLASAATRELPEQVTAAAAMGPHLHE